LNLQVALTGCSPLPRTTWLGILQSAPTIGRRCEAVTPILSDFRRIEQFAPLGLKSGLMTSALGA